MEERAPPLQGPLRPTKTPLQVCPGSLHLRTWAPLQVCPGHAPLQGMTPSLLYKLDVGGWVVCLDDSLEPKWRQGCPRPPGPREDLGIGCQSGTTNQPGILLHSVCLSSQPTHRKTNESLRVSTHFLQKGSTVTVHSQKQMREDIHRCH